MGAGQVQLQTHLAMMLLCLKWFLAATCLKIRSTLSLPRLLLSLLFGTCQPGWACATIPRRVNIVDIFANPSNGAPDYHDRGLAGCVTPLPGQPLRLRCGPEGRQGRWTGGLVHHPQPSKGGQEAPLPTASPWCQATEPKLIFGSRCVC